MLPAPEITVPDTIADSAGNNAPVIAPPKTAVHVDAAFICSNSSDKLLNAIKCLLGTQKIFMYNPRIISQLHIKIQIVEKKQA